MLALRNLFFKLTAPLQWIRSPRPSQSLSGDKMLYIQDMDSKSMNHKSDVIAAEVGQLNINDRGARPLDSTTNAVKSFGGMLKPRSLRK